MTRGEIATTNALSLWYILVGKPNSQGEIIKTTLFDESTKMCIDNLGVPWITINSGIHKQIKKKTNDKNQQLQQNYEIERDNKYGAMFYI